MFDKKYDFLYFLESPAKESRFEMQNLVFFSEIVHILERFLEVKAKFSLFRKHEIILLICPKSEEKHKKHKKNKKTYFFDHF